VLEPNPGIYIWHASVRQAEVEKAMQNCGLIVHQQIIWVKNKPVLGRRGSQRAAQIPGLIVLIPT